MLIPLRKKHRTQKLPIKCGQYRGRTGPRCCNAGCGARTTMARALEEAATKRRRKG